MKLLRSIIYIYQEQIVKEQILYEVVFVETFFVGNKQILYLVRQCIRDFEEENGEISGEDPR